jgi:hypothetical protein
MNRLDPGAGSAVAITFPVVHSCGHGGQHQLPLDRPVDPNSLPGSLAYLGTTLCSGCSTVQGGHGTATHAPPACATN